MGCNEDQNGFGLNARIAQAKREAREFLLLGHVAVFEGNDEAFITPANLGPLEELEALIARTKAARAKE